MSIESKILKAQKSFNADMAEHAAQERKKNQQHRSSDYGKDESRVVGAAAAFAAFGGAIAYAYITQDLQGATKSAVTATLIVPSVTAAVLGFVAHQAAPYRQEISEKLKGIGGGQGSVFKSFTDSVGKLGDKLGLTADAHIKRAEASALKADAKYIKGILGVDSMSNVKQTLNNTYDKHNSHSIMHDVHWLRTGIDTAVKDKLAARDTTPLSYKDIEAGIIKNMDKAGILAHEANDPRNKTNVMENVVLFVGNADRSNLGLRTGDFSKIADNHSLKMLKKRDADKSAPKLD